MTLRTVAVVHPLAMVAEGIAAALSTYPWIVSTTTATTASDGERAGRLADAAVVDPSLPGAAGLARRLTRDGVRVVQLGHEEDGAAHGGGLRVSLAAPIASLVAALVPEMSHARPSPSRLTPREREVLSLVARGLTGKEVARRLGISPKTVEMHKSRIYSKLRVPNQAAAVHYALSDGLVSRMNGAPNGSG